MVSFPKTMEQRGRGWRTQIISNRQDVSTFPKMWDSVVIPDFPGWIAPIPAFSSPSRLGFVSFPLRSEDFPAPPGWDLCLSRPDLGFFWPLQGGICAVPGQIRGFPALTCRSKALEEKAGMWQDRMGHQKGARLFLSSSGQSQPGWFSSPAEIQDQGSPSAQTPPLGSIPAPIQWIWDALHPLLRIVAVCRGKKIPKKPSLWEKIPS